MEWAPPYIGKLTSKLEMEVVKAEKQLIRAQKDLEFAKAYRDLCVEKLEAAKKEDEKKEI